MVWALLLHSLGVELDDHSRVEGPEKCSAQVFLYSTPIFPRCSGTIQYRVHFAGDSQ
jgi:hypothetical protein